MKHSFSTGYKQAMDLPGFRKFEWALQPPEPTSPVVGQLAIHDQITVRQLAILLRLSPYQIVADLMEYGVLTTPTDQVKLDLVSKVVRKYGYIAKKV